MATLSYHRAVRVDLDSSKDQDSNGRRELLTMMLLGLAGKLMLIAFLYGLLVFALDKVGHGPRTPPGSVGFPKRLLRNKTGRRDRVA